MTRALLETERLRLRAEAPGDRAVWRAHMNSEAVMAFLGGPAAPERIDESFDRMAQGWARDGYGFMLIERKADGVLIGKCGLSPIETPCAPLALRDAAQIGWTLRADAWGQGYAGEAARAVLAMGFGRHALPIIYGQTSQTNAPSWRLMEKLGMVRRVDLDYPDPDYPPRENPTMVYELAVERHTALLLDRGG